MICQKCGNPLHVLKGGNTIKDSQIVMVHIWGCFNPDCEMKELEQNRTETPQEQFNE